MARSTPSVRERYQAAVGRTSVVVFDEKDLAHILPPLLTMTGITYLKKNTSQLRDTTLANWMPVRCRLARFIWRRMKIPTLQSGRLTLRPYVWSDFGAFAALNADETVRRRVGGTLDRSRARRLFEQFATGECAPGCEVWAVTRRDTGDYLGHCWFILREGADCPELGLLIAAGHWRQGYGTEVALTLIRYGIEEARYPRLTATVDSDHLASIRALERAGMKRESERKDEQGVYFVYSAWNAAIELKSI